MVPGECRISPGPSGDPTKRLAGHTVGQAMNRHVAEVPVDLTLQQLVDDHVFGGGGRAFVVIHGDEPWA